MRIRTLAVATLIMAAGGATASADVDLVLRGEVNGETVVDETVTVPTTDADASVRVANLDLNTDTPAACITLVGLSVTQPGLLARDSGIGVACVGTP